MIKTFKHKGLSIYHFEDNKKGIQSDHAKKLARILDSLEAAQKVEDMDLLGYNLHELKGNYGGYHSVKVNGNYRVIFRFENGDAYDVDYLDYH